MPVARPVWTARSRGRRWCTGGTSSRSCTGGSNRRPSSGCSPTVSPSRRWTATPGWASSLLPPGRAAWGAVGAVAVSLRGDERPDLRPGAATAHAGSGSSPSTPRAWVPWCRPGDLPTPVLLVADDDRPVRIDDRLPMHGGGGPDPRSGSERRHRGRRALRARRADRPRPLPHRSMGAVQRARSGLRHALAAHDPWPLHRAHACVHEELVAAAGLPRPRRAAGALLAVGRGTHRLAVEDPGRGPSARVALRPWA